MSSLPKDLYQGVPQGFSTLLALLNQTKMGQQHFGPNDSMLASSIMHPVEGLNKAGTWLQNQVQAASQAPMDPRLSPQQAQDATQAGLNIAGLLQTGAMPFAPQGAGVLGTVRRPQDMVLPFKPLDYAGNPRGMVQELTPEGASFKQHPILKLMANYRKNNWLTDNDELVKYVDNGKPIRAELEGRALDGELSFPPGYHPDFRGIAEKFNFPGEIKSYHSLSKFDIIDKLRANEKLPPKAKEHISSVQMLADHARNTLGTKQVATTEAGKYFENMNDLGGLTNIVDPQKLKSMNTGFEGSDKINAIRNEQLKQVADSPYYQANKEKINVFDPNYQGSASGLDHLKDINPNPGRASYSDLIQNTIRHDEAAAKAAEKARFEGQNALDLKKVEPIKTLDNGTSWNKLIEPAALKVEGLTQGHCVATYEGKVASGKSQIFSLRSPDNKPILTAEWDPINKKMVQVKARFNAKPDKELKPYIQQLEDLLKKK